MTFPKGLFLHDPPPGYRPPRTRIGLKERQREARQDSILLRAATVIAVITGAALIVIIALMVATHG